MTSNKIKWLLGITCLWMLSLMGCQFEKAVAQTENVTIDINVKQISAGYVNVEFTADKKAFYLTGIHQVREEVDDINKVAKQFMLLALDSAYVDYLFWRNQQLQDMVPFVADFASYALQYGNTDHHFTLLKPSAVELFKDFNLFCNSSDSADIFFI